MKKYIKPDLYYENFELSHSVAACKVEGDDTMASANLSDGLNCVYEYFDVVLFNNGNCVAQQSEVFEDYCYQTGADGMNFFHS